MLCTDIFITLDIHCFELRVSEALMNLYVMFVLPAYVVILTSLRHRKRNIQYVAITSVHLP